VNGGTKVTSILGRAIEGKKRGEQHIELGKAVLANIHTAGEELINTKVGSWFYSNGMWEMLGEMKWLDVRIERACVTLGFISGTKLVNEARNWILRRPELWRKEALPWDQHGKIPTRSGLVDPLTGDLEPARPDHFCTWRIDVDYHPDATCPWWQQMAADMFGDKKPDEQSALVNVVRECVGAALIDKKPRALSKALVFWGNENRAKSGVLDVVTGLFGGKPITAPISHGRGHARINAVHAAGAVGSA
jgi:phage/plasmid-associated DNA primase